MLQKIQLGEDILLAKLTSKVMGKKYKKAQEDRDERERWLEE